jgi:hypothetical protein
VFRSSTQTWAELHEKAFRRLGGATRVVVLDNLREGVGKVESGVGHAQKTPLKGLRFETAEEAQAYLDRWEERWADTRIHGTKRQVAAMFAEQTPALLRLPVEPFRYYQYGERTVHLDGCVEVDAAYYGAPPDRPGVEVADGGHGAANRQPEWRTAARLLGKVSGMTRAATLPLGRGPAKPVRRDSIIASTAVVMTCP